MTYDASNRKDIRRAEKAAEELEQARINFLGAALSTPQGRTWFFHFLSDCHIFVNAPTFTAETDYFAFGERNIGLRIFNEILTHFPDALAQMQKEENVRLSVLLARDTATDAAKRNSADPDYSLPDPYDTYDGLTQ